MSIYTSQEEKVILKNNNEIETINLILNYNLKVFIVDNISNLKHIILPNINNLYVSINNCKSLEYIENGDFGDDNINKSYFYLGTDLDSLTNISLYNFEVVKIANETFKEIDNISIYNVKKLEFNLNNFPKLKFITLHNTNTGDIISSSDNITTFSIKKCNVGKVELLGKNEIEYFSFCDNKYTCLKMKNPLSNIISFSISDPDNIFPFLPLLKNNDTLCDFIFNEKTLYDWRYKLYLENSSNHISIKDNISYNCRKIDNIKFYYPQKKCSKP